MSGGVAVEGVADGAKGGFLRHCVWAAADAERWSPEHPVASAPASYLGSRTWSEGQAHGSE